MNRNHLFKDEGKKNTFLFQPSNWVSDSHFLMCLTAMWIVLSFIVAGSLSPLAFPLFLSPSVLSCHLGTEKNLTASKILSDMWLKVDSDAGKHAALLLW